MNDQRKKSDDASSAILIAEDDADQKNLLVDFAVSQVKRALEDTTLNDEQRNKLSSIQIISVADIAALKKAVSINKNVLLAILDCNMPDIKGSPSHDQFIKTNHRITGQHKAVDVVIKSLPNTPITMISSLHRFQKIISVFYKKEFDLDINFISKNDPSTIRRNIRYYLKQYLK